LALTIYTRDNKSIQTISAYPGTRPEFL